VGNDESTAKEIAMAARTGERAQRTGVFHCATCGAKVRVKEGDKIPKCPNGHTTFDARTQEPGTRS
jgi:DNA-directed RNA polymerase subunit RPC12/RpoP